MTAQVSRPQASMLKKPLLFQEICCFEKKLQSVLKKLQSNHQNFLGLTERILGRKIQVEVVDEDMEVSWNLDFYTLKVNRKYCQKASEMDLLQALLFEVQNAQQTEIFASYFQRVGELDVETFVRLIEWTEWRTVEKSIERLQEAGVPNKKISLMYTYFENFEAFYLQQQLEEHSLEIVERYYTLGGRTDSSYQGTWKVPFERRSLAHEILKELVRNYRRYIVTGEGKADLQYKIEVLESGLNPELDPKACEEALTNYHYFIEKYQSHVEESQS